MVSGNPAESHSINAEGLKRRGFSAEAISGLRRAYKTVFRKGLRLDSAIAELAAGDVGPELSLFIKSLKGSGRGIIR